MAIFHSHVALPEGKFCIGGPPSLRFVFANLGVAEQGALEGPGPLSPGLWLKMWGSRSFFHRFYMQ
jgi:hypothetical protein